MNQTAVDISAVQVAVVAGCNVIPLPNIKDVSRTTGADPGFAVTKSKMESGLLVNPQTGRAIVIRLRHLCLVTQKPVVVCVHIRRWTNPGFLGELFAEPD